MWSQSRAGGAAERGVLRKEEEDDRQQWGPTWHMQTPVRACGANGTVQIVVTLLGPKFCYGLVYFPKNFTKFFIFSVTLNLQTHA